MKKKCNAVFEGGGVKGIAFAGAITELEKSGYEFENLVGTSAGAIAAALLAVGYTGKEIAKELSDVDYELFYGKGKFGAVGSVVSFIKNYGAYNSGYFLRWFEGLLKRKNKLFFKDILTGSVNNKYRYKCQMIASDITQQQMLLLPKDLKQFGINPDNFSIALAVQMSMSIPFFYKPFQLKDENGKVHFIVDGGILSNYPLWVLDAEDGGESDVPTFGLKFIDDKDLACCNPRQISNIAEYSQSVLSTIIDGHDNYYISTKNGDFARSILISTCINENKGIKKIKSTDFDLADEEANALFKNGENAVREFLCEWQHEKWKKQYRGKPISNKTS